MKPAYIALGSNQGEPEMQLRKAVFALSALPRSRLDQVSSVYRSAAVGPGTQPDYLNAVARLQTELPAIALLDALQEIEREQGRVRSVRWGPRTLDLDLLLYARETITSPRLTVPHPRMQQRHFVLYPLCEISSENLLLPDGTALSALLHQCSQRGLVKTLCQLPVGTTTHCG
jgi:2-amino-4-hydroxy-6-hydroxymethyldihydropteridine diphosphokinase